MTSKRKVKNNRFGAVRSVIALNAGARSESEGEMKPFDAIRDKHGGSSCVRSASASLFPRRNTRLVGNVCDRILMVVGVSVILVVVVSKVKSLPSFGPALPFPLSPPHHPPEPASQPASQPGRRLKRATRFVVPRVNKRNTRTPHARRQGADPRAKVVREGKQSEQGTLRVSERGRERGKSCWWARTHEHPSIASIHHNSLCEPLLQLQSSSSSSYHP